MSAKHNSLVDRKLQLHNLEYLTLGSDESYFSWFACGLCDRRLGGDRVIAHFRDPHGGRYALAVCMDCVASLEGWDDNDNC